MQTQTRAHPFAIRQTRSVARWVCPQCDREFANRQSHVCVTGITVSELLGRHPAWMGAAYAVIIDHLRSLGPIHEDTVSVGIFLKSDRKVAEFRPRVRTVLLWFFLPHPLEHPRLGRTERVAAGRYGMTLSLTSAEEVDDQLLDWLAEAYDTNTD